MKAPREPALKFKKRKMEKSLKEWAWDRRGEANTAKRDTTVECWDNRMTKPSSLEGESQSEKWLVDFLQAKLSLLTSIKHKHE